MGLFYAFTQERVYRVETFLLPPLFEYIQPLNVLNNTNTNTNASASINDVGVDNVGVGNVNVGSVFDSFIDNANSIRLRQKFFKEFNLLKRFQGNVGENLSSKEINGIFESFSKSFKGKCCRKIKECNDYSGRNL